MERLYPLTTSSASGCQFGLITAIASSRVLLSKLLDASAPLVFLDGYQCLVRYP